MITKSEAPSTLPPARGRPRALADEAILDAALDAFGRLGFDGVSLRELNRELGASPAMLAKRFGTKDALWRAAVDHGFGRHRALMLAELDGRLDPATPSPEVLVALVEAFIRTAAHVPQLHQVVSSEAANDSPRLAYLYEQFIDPLLHGLVRPLLDALERRGMLRPVSNREVYFLVVNGAAAVCAFDPLSRQFDHRDGPLQLDRYASSVARLLVDAISV